MSEIDYRAVQRRVLLRWANRVLFVVNLVLFLSNALLPRVLQNSGDDFLRLVWFVVVLIHGAYTLKDLWPFRLAGTLLQRQTEREVERLRAQGYTVQAPGAPLEKPKRAARLTDDGEIDYDDEQPDGDGALSMRRKRTED